MAATTGKVGINNNLPPTIAFSLPKERVSGEVPVDLNISDPENDSVNLKLEVSNDNGSTWKSATITSGTVSGISNLNFSSTIFWDSAKDFPGLYSDKIAMRITPTDVNKNEGKPTVVSGIQVNNNQPPTVTITMGTPAVNGDVPVSYRISDAESDSNISLAPEYSPDGGFSWFPASTEGNLTGIGSSGYSGSLTWKSSKDAPGKNLDEVQFRITGTDYNRGESTTSFQVRGEEQRTANGNAGHTIGAQRSTFVSRSISRIARATKYRWCATTAPMAAEPGRRHTSWASPPRLTPRATKVPSPGQAPPTSPIKPAA